MAISGISAITSGARVNATPRTRTVSREDGISFDASIEDPDDVVVTKRRFRSSRPGKEAIRAAGSPAARSSVGVLEQLNSLKLGG